jgi:hypothetical protein
MDTRFWGPSAWRLLHLITFAYEPDHQKGAMRDLFTALPYVLPCKYCRQHLAGHMEKHPLEPALESRATLSRWLWTVHNEVNSARRDEGQEVKYENPSFEAVKRTYEDRLAEGCSGVEFEGWNFLFSVAEHHPFTLAVRGSAPIEGAPRRLTRKETRNKWNKMTSRERFPFYRTFWLSLGDCLPFAEWRAAWKSCEALKKRRTLGYRGSLIKELWRVRKCLERKLALENRESFESLCKRLKDHCVAAPRGAPLRLRRVTRKNT